ncbi:MAG TPA: hypothetical protein VED01_26720 [Burkholderiales bacterium]|nr:hypothetical protein [Burkholderiales bacterium]
MDKYWKFVLGAQDPEMREIQKAVTRAGAKFSHAAKDGVRCTPRTAYDANGVVLAGRGAIARPAVLPPQTPAVFVECTVLGHEPVARVDHHHPGDPGYAKGPEHYLEGSSLGQVLRLLEMEPTPTQRLLAAGDHCLTAAYQGECAGVDPNELLFLRASWRARVTGRTLGDVMEGILDAAKQVKRQYDSEYAESVFLDPTDISPDLAEGAAYAGKAVRYRQFFFPGGELKEMLKGAGPEHITRFMLEHERAGRHVYGNPYRGYAGAYLT